MRSRCFSRRLLLSLLILAGCAVARAQEKPNPSAAAEEPPAIDTDKLYQMGKQLFDDYATPEIKDQLEYPSKQQWDEFATRLQKALSAGSLEELAAFEPDARRALTIFRLMPDYSDYADWLTERLDMIEIARAASELPKIKKPKPPAEVKPGPSEPSEAATSAAVPYYDLWLARLRERPKPARADELLPALKVIFAAEGLPAELAWLAEVESSLNPSARSPAGARGLFQLMPATARSLGLSLLPFDERTQPGKSAHAAAKFLKTLHTRFDSWPLALAAYNVGETRLAAVLKRNQSSTFASIADELPAETRMYVPKVLATVAVRENVTIEKLVPARNRSLGRDD